MTAAKDSLTPDQYPKIVNQSEDKVFKVRERAVSGMDPANKVIIVVDEDIDPKNPDMVMWALSLSMQPHCNARIITGRVPLLDASAYSLISKPEERSYPPACRLFRNLDRRDAQRSLPARGVAQEEI